MSRVVVGLVCRLFCKSDADLGKINIVCFHAKHLVRNESFPGSRIVCQYCNQYGNVPRNPVASQLRPLTSFDPAQCQVVFSESFIHCEAYGWLKSVQSSSYKITSIFLTIIRTKFTFYICILKLVLSLV